jgi:TRAP-type C4-dicarboxylate transport system substrate-binding protein
MGIVGTWYYAGRLYMWHGIQYQVPFGIGDMLILGKIVTKMYEQMPEFRNEIEQYNQKILGCWPAPSYDIYSKTPILSLADFKGKKMGAIGIMGRWLEPLGATPVPSPIAERYMNLQTGVEDGGLLPISTLPKYKLEEVAPYITRVGLGCAFGCVLTINKDAWNELSKADQELFLKLAAKLPEKNAELSLAEEAKIIEEFKAKGVKFFDLPEEERAKWARLLPNLPRKYAAELDAKGLPGTEVFDLYFKLAKEAGWKFYRDWWAE